MSEALFNHDTADSVDTLIACLEPVSIRNASELDSKADGLRAAALDTPLGAMVSVSDERSLHLLEFTERKNLQQELDKLQSRLGVIVMGRTKISEQIDAEMSSYFKGTLSNFETPLAISGTEFSCGVWEQLCNIPFGDTRSYGELAKIIGRPTASRAVARANATNQIAVVIPCHRVIGANGSLTGYAGGTWRKQWLLEHESKFAVKAGKQFSIDLA